MNVRSALAELATLGANGDGIDRPLFTPAEHAARQTFARWAAAAGLVVEQDRVGNVFARVPGIDASLPPIQCGSHLDTVTGGGAYDGAYGVAGGLDAVARIAAQGAALHHPLEVVAWAGEEGSRFPLGCLGSSAYAGLTAYATIAALIGDDGMRFDEAAAGPAGLLPGIPVRDHSLAPAAYIELHVEQGPVLERRRARLGAVTAIAGQRRLQIDIDGTAGHAGTIPMTGRSDALCAAADLVLAVEAAALAAGDSVATVGFLTVVPNATNIVPGRVTLRVDARSVDDARVAAIETDVRAAAREIEHRRGTSIQIALLERRAAAPLDPGLRTLVLAHCRALDPGCVELPSGAGHDAMCVAQIAPAAMIFVPSIGGHSHVACEKTDPSDLELGVEALAAVLVAADRTAATVR